MDEMQLNIIINVKLCLSCILNKIIGPLFHNGSRKYIRCDHTNIYLQEVRYTLICKQYSSSLEGKHMTRKTSIYLGFFFLFVYLINQEEITLIPSLIVYRYNDAFHRSVWFLTFLLTYKALPYRFGVKLALK